MKKILKFIVLAILNLQAGIYLKKYKPQIIIVCGQNFRSEIKDSLVEFLNAAGLNVRGSFRGYNSEIGLLLSILNLRAGFSSFGKWLRLIFFGFASAIKKPIDALVLEVVIENESDVDNLLKIVKPNILIFTDFNGDLSENKEIKSACEKMLAATSAVALMNIDCESIVNLSVPGGLKKVFFGFGASADLKAQAWQELENGQSFVCKYNNLEKKIFIKRFGRQAVYSVLINNFFDNFLEIK